MLKKANQTSFKKGQTPWNKGKRFPQFSGENNVSKRDDVRKKISLKLKGRIFTEEHRRKIGIASKGRNLGNKFALGNFHKMSEDAKNKIRISKMGNKNPSWKGGITPINLRIRTSSEYKLWRTAVFVRDNYTCIWCGARNGNGKTIILHADHIKPFSLFPELRFAIDNGRTLCIECHRKTDTYGNRLKKII